jgi:Pyruvate/2-oxoacid:ferredoxin oxidoreductase delta subunit
MRFTSFYFSGTGNTKWAVEQFTKIAIESGHNAEMISIEEDIAGNADCIQSAFKSSDFIGIAYPVYGADMPKIYKQFLCRLGNALKNVPGPALKNRKTFIITTVGFMNGYGPIKPGKILHGMSLKLCGHVFLRMAMNTITPAVKMKAVSRVELDKRKEIGRVQLKLLLDDLAAGKKHIKGIGPHLGPGNIIRSLLSKTINNYYKQLGVNIKTCTHCMQCVKNCPEKNIEYRNDSFIFHENCTACMRCYNLCPSGSILADGRYADPKLYARYLGPEMGFTGTEYI